MVADASLARRELGWEPVHSDLETITRTAWNWFNRSGA
jgi:UDP-glucose 4-epimerase